VDLLGLLEVVMRNPCHSRLLLTIYIWVILLPLISHEFESALNSAQAQCYQYGMSIGSLSGDAAQIYYPIRMSNRVAHTGIGGGNGKKDQWSVRGCTMVPTTGDQHEKWRLTGINSREDAGQEPRGRLKIASGILSLLR
jgi:hypothetical protein